MLVSFDENGKPTVVSVVDINHIFSIIVDKSECLLEMSNLRFNCLFDTLLKTHTNPQKGCPLRQLAQRPSRGE